jgi:hypothetical protein
VQRRLGRQQSYLIAFKHSTRDHHHDHSNHPPTIRVPQSRHPPLVIHSDPAPDSFQARVLDSLQARGRGPPIPAGADRPRAAETRSLNLAWFPSLGPRGARARGTGAESGAWRAEAVCAAVSSLERWGSVSRAASPTLSSATVTSHGGGGGLLCSLLLGRLRSPHHGRRRRPLRRRGGGCTPVGGSSPRDRIATGPGLRPDSLECAIRRVRQRPG